MQVDTLQLNIFRSQAFSEVHKSHSSSKSVKIYPRILHWLNSTRTKQHIKLYVKSLRWRKKRMERTEKTWWIQEFDLVLFIEQKQFKWTKFFRYRLRYRRVDFCVVGVIMKDEKKWIKSIPQLYIGLTFQVVLPFCSSPTERNWVIDFFSCYPDCLEVLFEKRTHRNILRLALPEIDLKLNSFSLVEKINVIAYRTFEILDGNYRKSWRK